MPSHLLRFIFSFWSTMPFCDGLVYSYFRENSNLQLQGKFASLIDWHISPLQHHIITQEWKCENKTHWCTVMVVRNFHVQVISYNNSEM
jgi:hypothetical protein